MWWRGWLAALFVVILFPPIGTSLGGTEDPSGGAAAVDISASEGHTCARLADGNVACWGNNEHNQSRAYTGGDARAIAVSGATTCILSGRDQIFCQGVYGGTFEADREVVRMGLGKDGLCILLADRNVYCADGDAWLPYYTGGDAIDMAVAAPGCIRHHRQSVEGAFSSISCIDRIWGNYTTVGLALPNVHQCWTWDHEITNMGPLNPPPPVPWGGCVSPHTPRAFAVGEDHLCAVVPASNARIGPIDCWGYNVYGQADPPEGVEFSSVSAGGHHTCGLIAAGDVLCWGRNHKGQAAGYGGGDAIAVAAGTNHACAALERGDVVCWGDDTQGQAAGHQARPVATGNGPADEGPLRGSMDNGGQDVPAGGPSGSDPRLAGEDAGDAGEPGLFGTVWLPLALLVVLALLLVGRTVLVAGKRRRDAEAAEAALVRARAEELEESLYGATHDMKTPLITLDWLTADLESALQEARTEAEVRETLDHIRATVGGMDRLVQDLLLFARAEKEPVPEERTEVAPIVRDVVRSLHGLQREKRARVVVEVSGAVGLAPAHLRHVVENLVSNALKYGRPGGEVQVIGRPARDGYRLVVQDDGPGVPVGEEEHIFEPFRRGSNISGAGGTGLGLALVRSLVRRSGGDVSVRRVNPQGARFTVRLPGDEG